MLDFEVDMSGVAASFPLLNALRNGCNSRIVSFFNHLERFRYSPVVVADFRWPADAGSVRKVSSPDVSSESQLLGCALKRWGKYLRSIGIRIFWWWPLPLPFPLLEGLPLEYETGGTLGVR